MRLLHFPALSTLLICAGVLQASSITIQNPGFETASLTQTGNGTFSQLIAGSTIFAAGGTLSGWTATSTTTEAAAGAFDPSAGGVNWTSTWWAGNDVGYLQESSGTVSLSQTLTATLSDSTTYTLSALIGRRTFTPAFNYSLQLRAGNTLLVSAGNLSLASNSFGSDSAVYTCGAANPLAG